jgi:hypothetical protein
MILRFFIFILALSFIFISCRESAVEPISNHQVELKGFTYTTFDFHGFQQGHNAQAINELVNQTGAEWIALCMFEYQSTSTTHDIAPNTTGRNPLTNAVWSTSSTMEDLRQGIYDARNLQKKIMLKPHIDLYTGDWRAAINPDTAWFSAFTSMMLKYALLADSNHIEMICIGDEYVVATQSKFTSNWRKLIAEIRKVYSGKLTYASNWSGAFAYGITIAEFQQVEFWNDLDYIGIDAYYPLTNSVSDDIPSALTAMNKLLMPLNQIESVSKYFNKSVLFTEIGIQSVKGALAEPWNYSLGAQSNAIQDNEAQDFYYHIILKAFGKQEWCAGFFWWNWESVISTNENTNFTPRNKPAAGTLRQFYTLQ